jgi:hypothetical protein
MNRIIISVFLVILAVILWSCSGGSSDTQTGTGTGTGSSTSTSTGSATVSFAADVVPLFSPHGCTSCHGSAGGLSLYGSTSAIYAELVTEVPNTRVNTSNPAASTLLTFPLTGSGVSHQKAFSSASDPDYQTILQWITEGALNN